MSALIAQQLVVLNKDWFKTKLDSTEDQQLIQLFNFVIDHYRLKRRTLSKFSFNGDMQCLRYTLPTTLNIKIKNMLASVTYEFMKEAAENHHDVNILKIVEYLSVHYRINFQKAAEDFVFLDCDQLRKCIPFAEISTKILVDLNNVVYSYYRCALPESLRTESVNLTNNPEYAEKYLDEYNKFESHHMKHFQYANTHGIEKHHENIMKNYTGIDAYLVSEEYMYEDAHMHPIEKNIRQAETTYMIPKCVCKSPM